MISLVPVTAYMLTETDPKLAVVCSIYSRPTIRAHATAGLLITFFQFVFTSSAAYLTQFSSTGKFGLKQNQVPLSRWAYTATLFCAINVLNNWAFAFNISVPVHIILRSFGSVTTMIAGVIRGKRYSALQILSVVILTIGVLVSAWADSKTKVSTSTAVVTQRY